MTFLRYGLNAVMFWSISQALASSHTFAAFWRACLMAGAVPATRKVKRHRKRESAKGRADLRDINGNSEADLHARMGAQRHTAHPDTIHGWTDDVEGWVVRGDRAVRFRDVSLAG